MPKANKKKIKSALRNLRARVFKPYIIFLALLLTGALVLFLIKDFWQTPHCQGVILQSRCFKIERADNAQERAQGLSGRASLGQDSAMLFVFDQNDSRCFWMKDVRFGIDMIFIDQDFTVNKIEKNVLPETYPKYFCSDGTKYVIEVNQGTSELVGLQSGDRVVVD